VYASQLSRSKVDIVCQSRPVRMAERKVSRAGRPELHDSLRSDEGYKTKEEVRHSEHRVNDDGGHNERNVAK
jgi:hypothetical protein